MEIWDQIEQLINSVPVRLLLSATQKLLTRMEGVLHGVIRTTASRFPDLEGTEATLQDWTASETFEDLFNNVEEGVREPDNKIVDGFIEQGGFFLPDETELRSRAHEIIVAFIAELAKSIYKTDEGLSFHANREEKHHAMTHEGIRGLQQTMQEFKATIGSPQTPPSVSDLTTTPPDDLSTEDEILKNRIDLARDLLNRGLLRTARTELEKIRNEVAEASSHLRFRYLTNLAACALAEEDTETASNLLEQAYLLEPENIKGITNAALSAHLKGDSDRAKLLAHKALSLAPNDSQVTAILIVELSRHDTTDDLDAHLSQNDWIPQDKTCALALAGILLNQSRADEAIEVCRTLVEVYADDPDVHLALAEHLMYARRQDAPAAAFSQETVDHYVEIDRETTLALELLRDTQLEARKARALFTRGCARALLRQSENAVHDLDRVLEIEPGNVDAIYNKGLVCFNDGRLEEARALLELALDSSRGEEARLVLADIALLSGDVDAAIALLDGTLVLEDMSWEDMHRAQMLRKSELASQAVDSIGPAVYEAVSHNPADPKLLTLAALCRQQDDELVEAESLLLQASVVADETDAQTVTFFLARLYDDLARYSEAADQYARIVGKVATHPSALSLLRCLYSAGRLGEALEWAQEIQSQVEDLPRTVIEVEAYIRELAGDLERAIACIETLCSRPDSAPHDKVWLARMLYRHGDGAAAYEMVSSIRTPQLREHSKELMSLAQLKRFLGLPGFLEDAYQARRQSMGDPSIHLAYLNIFVDHEDDLSETNLAGPGTWVHLRGESGEQWWCIADDQDVPSGSHEIASNDPLARQLTGKQVGDSIVLRRDIEVLTYEVMSIQNKYVHAFQETVNEFSTRFPGDKNISRVDVSDDDISAMLRVLDSRYRMVSDIEAMYREGRLPFTSLASLLGVSLVEAWAACTQDGLTQVRFSIGAEDDSRKSASLLDGADCLILDTVSLLTVQELGLRENLLQLFSRVVVPQAVIDGLHEAHAMATTGRSPEGWLSKSHDGTYLLRDAEPEELANRAEFLGRTLHFARSFEPIASYPLLYIGNREELADLLSPVGAGTVFAGTPSSSDVSLLLCDDLELARFAESEGILSVNTQQLLSYMLARGVITAEEHAAAIEKLVRLNYWFVRVGPGDIVSCLQLNNYQTTHGIRAMFKTLEGPHCTDDSAVAVLAEVMLSAMTEAPRERHSILASLAIATLRHGRELRPVLFKFRDVVWQRFASVPHLRQELIAAINLHIHTKV